jgi:hypothetical protein
VAMAAYGSTACISTMYYHRALLAPPRLLIPFVSSKHSIQFLSHLWTPRLNRRSHRCTASAVARPRNPSVCNSCIMRISAVTDHAHSKHAYLIAHRHM